MDEKQMIEKMKTRKEWLSELEKAIVDEKGRPGLALRPTVYNFAQQMECQLREHAARNGGGAAEKDNEGWIDCPMSFLLTHLKEQFDKVTNEAEDFIDAESCDERRAMSPCIARHAVHLANYAMMVADVVQTKTNPRAEFKSDCGAAVYIHKTDDGLWLRFQVPSGKAYAFPLEARTSIAKSVMAELETLLRDGNKP